jgi:nitrate/TMAO reductase-like tetraheme cytochrome c subunit
MAVMRCPSCGESVELAKTGMTFKHVFRPSGVSSMFHDETLVHQCDAEVAERFQAQHEHVSSARWYVRL